MRQMIRVEVGKVLRTQRSVCWLVVSLQSFHAPPPPPPPPPPHGGGGGGGVLVWNMKPGGGHLEGVSLSRYPGFRQPPIFGYFRLCLTKTDADVCLSLQV
ncbi:unnamed protein product [Arctogadus glacialis]